MRGYDLIADWYARDRSRTIGVAEALAVAQTLPRSSHILDVGCGNGVPITESLINAGHRVTGLESSMGMLMHFRKNLRATPVVQADVRWCPFANNTFDAAISWGMIFHLPPREQASALADIARVLKEGAPFLFTAAEIENADEQGITGEMNGVTFRYYAVPNYRTMLAAVGMVLVDVYGDPDVSTYFLARKTTST